MTVQSVFCFFFDIVRTKKNIPRRSACKKQSKNVSFRLNFEINTTEHIFFYFRFADERASAKRIEFQPKLFENLEWILFDQEGHCCDSQDKVYENTKKDDQMITSEFVKRKKTKNLAKTTQGLLLI